MPESSQFISLSATRTESARVLETLRTRWKNGELPDIWEALGQSGGLSPTALAELLRDDQTYHWQKHQPVLVERYFERCPQLLDFPSEAFTLVATEVQLRQALRQGPTLAEYERRFPRFQTELPPLFATSAPSPPDTKADTLLGQTIFPTPNASTASATTVGVPASTSPPLDQTLFPGNDAGSSHNTAAQPTLFIANPANSANTINQTLFPPAGGAFPIPAPAALPDIPGYEVIDELGRGGMGVVYKARQIRAGRNVALKVIRPDMLGLMPSDTQSNTIGRFRHEARAAGRLQHDNIVTVFEVGEWNSYHYFAMRLVDGPSLIQLVRERPLENKRAAAFLAGTARGVQYAHEQGILHRDLKPHNVLIDSRSQRALVADFGLAKFTSDSDELTRAGDVIGTPSYMSPEQAKDSSTVTALSDVYSLGATLYHVLAGRPPFQAANLGETIRQIIHEEPLSPRQLNPAVDHDLETICIKCLQKEPARRYSSAGELADDLERYLRGEPILARPVSDTEKVVRWCRRNPALAGSIATAILLAVIAVSAIVVGYRNTAAALAKSEESLRQSEESLSAALSAVDDLLTRVSEEDLKNQPGLQQVRRELLLKANERLQAILQKNVDNPRIRLNLAKAYFNVGSISIELNQAGEALRSLKEAERLQQLMLASDPTHPDLRLALSDTLNAFGLLYTKLLKEQQSAVDAYTAAVALRDAMAKEFPDNEEQLRKQANTHMNLGFALNKQKRRNNAQQELETAQKIRAALFQKNPASVKVEQDLAMGAYQLAIFHLDDESQAAVNEGEEPTDFQFKKAIAIYESLIIKQPRNLLNRSRLVECYRFLASRAEIDPTNKAGDIYEKAIPVAEQLARGNPDVEEYAMIYAQLLLQYGDFLERSKELDKSQQMMQEIDRTLAPLAERNADACQMIAHTHRLWANILLGQNKAVEEQEHLQQALHYWIMYASKAPDDAESKIKIGEITRLLQPENSANSPESP